MFAQAAWLNPPQQWTRQADHLTVVTDAHTDFWRATHYGFVRDNGHFLHVQTAGAFTAQVKVEGAFAELYDQAGLMVRVDEAHWVKIGAELSDGVTLLSSVLTDEVSDWATGVFPGDPQAFWIRATVANGVLRVQVSVDGVHWPLVRLAPFPVAASYQVGPYCCTPERAGLQVRFSEWQVGVPNGKSLHDLS